MSNSEFGEQLQYAIMDLIRDRELTRQGYERGYDQVNVVQRNYHMWRDNFVALFHRGKILQSVGAETDTAFVKDYMPIISDHLNPYVDQLQKKYADQIFIDVDAFEEIDITRTDLVAIQRDVPYPILVPGFPLLTTDHDLDYGQKLEQKK